MIACSIAEHLAEKIRTMRRGGAPEIKQARVAEVLWFIEWALRQPGGAEALAARLKEDFPDRFCWPKQEEGFTWLYKPSGLGKLLTDLVGPGHDLYLEPHCCPTLLDILCQHMDRYAAEVEGQLADSATRRTVFRELAFAMESKVPVPFVGDSRVGKTKISAVWSQMRPGLARMVTIPSDPSERDFMRAHADALGIAYNSSTTVHILRERVENVLADGDIFLLYDEAAFVLPLTYSDRTPPKRLNWIRCQVVDRGIGCALFMTPQNRRGGRPGGEDRTLARYVEKTGYVLEQWLGRMRPNVVLPAELEREDLLAIARHNFPGIPDRLIQLIAARAMQSEGYLHNIELTAKRALFVAGEKGRRVPAKEDVLEAISDMMPSIAAQRKPQKDEIPTPGAVALGGRGDIADPPQNPRRGAAETISRAITTQPRSDMVGV